MKLLREFNPNDKKPDQIETPVVNNRTSAQNLGSATNLNQSVVTTDLDGTYNNTHILKSAVNKATETFEAIENIEIDTSLQSYLCAFILTLTAE